MERKRADTVMKREKDGESELAGSLAQPSPAQGYLKKMSTKGNWQTRWFEIRGPFLCYWQSHLRAAKKGEPAMPDAAYDLRKIASITLDDDDFEIVLLSNGGNKYVLTFAKASDKSHLSVWLSVLKSTKALFTADDDNDDDDDAQPLLEIAEDDDEAGNEMAGSSLEERTSFDPTVLDEKRRGTVMRRETSGESELADSLAQSSPAQGYLKKMSTKGNWQRRWFEVHGPFFCYWQSHAHAVTKGKANMPNAAYDLRKMESITLNASDVITMRSKSDKTFKFTFAKTSDKAHIATWLSILKSTRESARKLFALSRAAKADAAAEDDDAQGQPLLEFIEEGDQEVEEEEEEEEEVRTSIKPMARYPMLLDAARFISSTNPENLAVKHVLALGEEEKLNSLPAHILSRLVRCSKTGFENPNSSLGCYAMSPGDYDDLDFFFDQVCNDYHDNPNGDKVHSTNWSLDGVEGLPGDGQLDISKLGLAEELSMRVRVGRNLTTFPLPGAMSKPDRIAFEKQMLVAFDKLIADPEYGGQVFSMTPNEDWKEVTGDDENPNLISAEKYQELVDAHVMFKDMAADPYLKSAGIALDWPCGRGCYQSADGGFIIWFGEEDQLRILCMAKGYILNSVFDRLRSALEMVESIDGIEFATSEKYGYVTSCPSNLGTGMRASVHLKIPNLTADGTDTKAKDAAKPLGLSVRGTGGEHTPIGADGTVDISPSKRLFITEAEIVTKLYNGIKLLLEQEEALAPKTAEEQPEPVKEQKPVEKSGYMHKHGHGFVNMGTKLRWFEMTNSKGYYYLKYYVDETKAEQKGVITLKNATAAIIHATRTSVKIQIVEEAHIGGKIYLLQCDTKEDADDWLAKITAATGPVRRG